MSGSDAVEIADRVYKSPGGKKRLKDVLSHTIHYGYIYDGDQLIDEVIVLVMKAPHSYTTEGYCGNRLSWRCSRYEKNSGDRR